MFDNLKNYEQMPFFYKVKNVKKAYIIFFFLGEQDSLSC